MKLESVKLEKQMVVNGQESKCYSVEPVLRCLDGCYPVKTTPVTVGFHCQPKGESRIIVLINCRECNTFKAQITIQLFLHFSEIPFLSFLDSILSQLTSFYEKSVDLRETVEAHVACRCTAECA